MQKQNHNMRTERKSSIKNSATRLILIALLVLIQTGWMIVLMSKLNTYSTAITLTMTCIAVIIALKVFGTHVNSAQRMPWLIVITAVPFFGICIYLLFGRSIVTKGMRRRFNGIEADILKNKLKQDEQIIKELEQKDLGIANQCRYISNTAKYPVYKNTDMEYYNTALESFEAQLWELSKAEKFIFMEYHAIEDAISFERLKKVLIDKAKNGVEVRIFYDDLGSIFFLNKEFIKRMRDEGIQCRVFNPLKVIVNMFMNNRDHRKITVIDGKVGFTGGYNLADEYFNITHPYGYWKDTGVKLTGDAVKSLTASFLTMWNAIDHTDSQEAYDEYIDATDGTYNAAKHYVYITTPYLIITDEMERELRLAVKRGVDVRIVTPGIPDKKMVYKITRSYYEPLCSAGVRIYEYTPGFCHAKQWVSDDEVCVVGTINMDFRSLYLHFENAVFTYNRELAGKVKADMLNNFEISNEVTSDYAVDVIRPLKLGTCMLHMISPLL